MNEPLMDKRMGSAVVQPGMISVYTGLCSIEMKHAYSAAILGDVGTEFRMTFKKIMLGRTADSLLGCP